MIFFFLQKLNEQYTYNIKKYAPRSVICAKHKIRLCSRNYKHGKHNIIELLRKKSIALFWTHIELKYYLQQVDVRKKPCLYYI